MDVKAQRRQILKAHMENHLGGKQTALAEALEVSANYVSRMLSDPSTKGHKRIGEEFAREIEHKLGLPVRALDGDLQGNSSPPPHIAETPAKYDLLVGKKLDQFLAEFKKLPQSMQMQVSTLVHGMVNELVLAGRHKHTPPAKSVGPKTHRLHHPHS